MDPELIVIDVDGNVYNAVKIGEQIWMAKNLQVTRYANKEPISLVRDQKDWFDLSDDSKAYYYYNNNQNLGYIYGALYSWPAAVNKQNGDNTNSSNIQ